MHRKFQEGLRAFWDMILDNVAPNDFTLLSVLSVCARMGALDQGRLIALGTALVDMYAKCGCVDEALRVFENLQVKNVYTWTAIINGLAVHGDALGALNIFSCMLKSGIQPNEVTFVGVLAACSHGGFVEEGKRLFESMKYVYHFKPEMDHYAFEMGEHIGNLLVNQPPNHSGNYALMANLYKMFQNWEVSAQVRKLIKGLRVEKTPRYSLTEVDDFNS
uniref:Pentacotripeptide-repeat region of PRORP domain-containing protein n=1 Tax=Glycine max TaxID=3847 RepID=K7LSS5_SOYBN